MPMIHHHELDGTPVEIPTPEETVVALLEQGETPEQIIAAAEQAIATAKAGITWVNAEADTHRTTIDEAVGVQLRAQEALNQAKRGGASTDAVTKAQEALDEAANWTAIHGAESGAAQIAASQHRGHANETITFAERRIAAAQDPELVAPAVKRYEDLKKAEKAALKATA